MRKRQKPRNNKSLKESQESQESQEKNPTCEGNSSRLENKENTTKGILEIENLGK